MKQATVFPLVLALLIAGCDKQPQFGVGIEKSDRVPQAIIKGGQVYQYMSGEYVPIPVSEDLPKDKQSRSFTAEIGSNLTAKINLFYAYGEAHYQVKITLKDTKGKTAKQISDELQGLYLATSPYTIQFLQNGFGIESIDITTPDRILESFGPNGEGYVGSYQSDGAFSVGPTKYASIDGATMRWH